MARPSILSDELIADFCSKLRISGSIETAIKASGIGRESYYGWARKVREGRGNKMQKRFMRAVDDAEGETKLMREHMLTKFFDKSWQSLAWWLERKYSHEYGQRSPVPLPDPDAGQEQLVEGIFLIRDEKPKKGPPVPEPAPEPVPEPI